MIHFVRRNFSSKGPVLSQATGIVVSVPKSGRTWLRVLVQAYVAAVTGMPFSLNTLELQKQGAPHLIFTHDLWQHLTTRRFKDRIRGKYLVPPGVGRRKPMILLARDPRDVVVSLFFQLTKRTAKYDGSLAEMIRDPGFGIGFVVEVMNTWMANWGAQNNCQLLRYEDCRNNPVEAFRPVISVLGFGVDEEKLVQSVEFASFDNMKKMETQREFASGMLRPADVNDHESFKVRRGVVGGYQSYLDSGDIEYLDQQIRGLDSRYGYGSS